MKVTYDKSTSPFGNTCDLEIRLKVALVPWLGSAKVDWNDVELKIKSIGNKEII